ncbi:uncharacterized protein LOC143274666 [Babylonia areolata]|uniref:uncharacterized protein LOC143274666 n=1 Tax=Babylonia areolata TaxID=304850 RepID=UPI003FD23335
MAAAYHAAAAAAAAGGGGVAVGGGLGVGGMPPVGGGGGGGGGGGRLTECAGCERPILDKFLLNVLDRDWHVKCLQCCECKSNLTEKCFFRDGQLYCRTDFFRRFGTKCAGCTQGISPNDLVRRARNKVFHLKCFTCMVCHKQLTTGEELYILDESKFICKDDYINKYVVGSDAEDDGDPDSGIEAQGAASERDYSLDGDSSSHDSKDPLLGALHTNNNNTFLNNNTNNGGGPPGNKPPGPPPAPFPGNGSSSTRQGWRARAL